MEQFIVQLKGVVITAIWTAIATYAILKLTGFVVPLRVNKDVEVEGLDLAQHGERGYHNN